MKEFEKIVQNKAIFEVERKRLEKFRSTKDEIQTRFSETTPYTIQIFTDCGDVSNCLSNLFGKLTQKNKQIGMKMDAAVCCKTDLHKIKEEEPPNGFAKSKATPSMCSNHRSSNAEVCSRQQKACSMSPSEKSSKTAVPVLTDISINRMDAGPKQATENVLQLKIHMTKSLKGSTAKQQK